MKVIYKQAWLNAVAASDYDTLQNVPQINGEDILENKTTEDVNIAWFGTQAEFNALTPEDETLYIIEDGDPSGELNDYVEMVNKPTINGVEITGNKTSDDIGMYNVDEVDNILASLRSIYAVTSLPASPSANTMYYVGPNAEGIYHVYLYDSLTQQIDLGLSKMESYKPGTAIGIDNTVNEISAKYINNTIKYNSTSEYLYIRDMTGTKNGTVGGISGAAPAPPANSKAGQWPGAKGLADNGTWKAIVDLLYPVGSIYVSVKSDNPSTLVGGTWEAWGTGRVPIGVDTGDADFNSVSKTGGGKTHSHGANTYGAQITLYWTGSGNIIAWKTRYSDMWTASGSTDGYSYEFHYNEPDTSTHSTTKLAQLGGTSGSASSLQPYITCYMWKRTA